MSSNLVYFMLSAIPEVLFIVIIFDGKGTLLMSGNFRNYTSPELLHLTLEPVVLLHMSALGPVNYLPRQINYLLANWCVHALPTDKWISI